MELLELIVLAILLLQILFFENNTASDNKGSCIYDNQVNPKYLTLSVGNNIYINNSPANNTIHTEGKVNFVDLDGTTRINADNIDMDYGDDKKTLQLL